MTTAFQINAFQNNAFQISGGAVIFQPGSKGHKHDFVLFEKYPDFEEQYSNEAIAILLLSD